MKKDEARSDPYNGYPSHGNANRCIERMMGFSRNNPESPLGGVYFTKERGGWTFITMTLFAQEGKLDEFQAWLKATGLNPSGMSDIPTQDSTFNYSKRGIFGSAESKDIERLRKIITEHSYQIEPSFAIAFNNICNSQTGIAPLYLPD